MYSNCNNSCRGNSGNVRSSLGHEEGTLIALLRASLGLSRLNFPLKEPLEIKSQPAIAL